LGILKEGLRNGAIFTSKLKFLVELEERNEDDD
jgi:hypothetical protein